MVYHSGIGRFHADPGKVSDFPGQSGNDVLRRIQSYADNVDFQFAVGNSHSADDIVAIFMEKGIQLPYRFAVFHDDADYSHTGFHSVTSLKSRRCGYSARRPFSSDLRTDAESSG